MVKRQRRSTGGGHGKHRAKKRKAATNPGPLGSSSGSGDGGAKVPRSFILHSGAVSSSVSTLLHDLRSTFEPYTAANLRQTRSNRMKDFVNISGILGVSHMMVLHQPGMQRKNKAKIAAGDTLGSNGQSSVSAASDTGRVNLRIATLPHGPTLTFRVNKYSLRKDILHSQKRPPTRGNEYLTPPLLVLNNFTSQAQTGSDGKPLGTKGKEVQLMISLFQNLFPPIHVQTMHLSSARRIVLLHYNPATKTIDWRHYIIQVRPVGVSKRLRRVVEVNSATPASAVAAAAAAAGISLAGTSNKRKGLPDLGNVNDISDYVLGRRSRIGGGDESRDEDNGDDAHSGFETDASTDADDSDVEDGEGGSARRNTVDLFQDYMGRGNAGKASQRAREAGSNQRAVKLRELGPRMELRLIKIEEGFGGGEVLYHDYVKKSAADAAEQRRSHVAAAKLKAERRAEQEQNVQRKKAEREALKTKSGRRGARTGDEESDEDGDTAYDIDGDSDSDSPSRAGAGETRDDDDEFDYEDRFGGEVERHQPAAFDGGLEDEDEEEDDDDVLGDDAELFEGMASEGGDYSDEDDEDEEQDEDEDSDLSPIEITSDFEEIFSEDEQPATSAKLPPKGKGRSARR